jgi:hypothetical protein
LFIPVIEIAHVRSEALKNTTLHRNCLGCKGLRSNGDFHSLTYLLKRMSTNWLAHMGNVTISRIRITGVAPSLLQIIYPSFFFSFGANQLKINCKERKYRTMTAESTAGRRNKKEYIPVSGFISLI